MSNSLPTQARALADELDPTEDELSLTVVGTNLLRSLADLCDTYREALAYAEFLLREARPFVAAHEPDPQHLTVSIDEVTRARLALATGEQANETEAHQ